MSAILTYGDVRRVRSDACARRGPRQYNAAQADALIATGLAASGYEWGRFGLAAVGWFPGVAPVNYPLAWRSGYRRGHADWETLRTCHRCGAVIPTTAAATAHQKAAHPWILTREEVIRMRETPGGPDPAPEPDPDPEQDGGEGQPRPEPEDE